MCGIVGYGGVPGGLDIETLLASRDAMVHRGPDSSGCWISDDGRVALAHRRLAIVELSDAGAQPMVSHSGELALTFNGEIYNHSELRRELSNLGWSFRGHSDTEVLLVAYAQWGVDCLERLRGMFAFAIWDGRREALLLVRDRAGEKPLYWARYRGGVFFASELKALLADSAFPRNIDLQGLDAYLTFGYVPAELCLVKGVAKVPPGHWVEWSRRSGEVRSERYWRLPAPNAPTNVSDEAAVERLHELLASSVREQLQADVPVAVLLSGGTDSSLVTALAAAVSSEPVRTYSVGFPGHEAFDERRYARRIAEHFGTRHTELPLEAANFDVLPELALLYDEPIADSSMIPTFLLSRLVGQHCKVVLGGDGGDELFGGYRAYQGSIRQAQARRVLPAAVRAGLAHVATALLPVGFRNRNGLIGLGGSLSSSVSRVGVMFDAPQRERLVPLLADTAKLDEALRWKEGLVEPQRGVPGAFMAADFMSFLPEDILVKVDRASMANSLEVRAPFLDVRIIEFAYRDVPNRLRATIAERKILLKRLAQRVLPRDFDANRKQGFSIPLANWMTSGYRAQCCDAFDCIYPGLFDPHTLRALLSSQHAAGLARVFGLLLLMQWMQAHRIVVE